MGLKAGVCEVDAEIQGRGRGLVRPGGEQGEHFLVDIDAQGARCEDVAPEVEFPVAE